MNPASIFVVGSPRSLSHKHRHNLVTHHWPSSTFVGHCTKTPHPSLSGFCLSTKAPGCQIFHDWIVDLVDQWHSEAILNHDPQVQVDFEKRICQEQFRSNTQIGIIQNQEWKIITILFTVASCHLNRCQCRSFSRGACCTAAKSPAITKSIDATFQHRLIAANAVVAQDGEVNAFVPGQQMAVVVFWSCPKQMAVSHGGSVPLDWRFRCW